MIKVSQEGERAGAGLMSRVTVLIDWGSREVAPVCSTNPSWFPHIAFFNYTKCLALVTGNLGMHRPSLGICRSTPYIMHSTLCMKIRNTSQSCHHFEMLSSRSQTFSLPEFVSGGDYTVAWLDMKCQPVICSCCRAISKMCPGYSLSEKREMLQR